MNRDEADKIATMVKEANPNITSTKVTMASVQMVVHRAATGKDENYGIVSYFHSNPLKHYPVNFMIWLRGRKRLWRQYLPIKVKK